MRLPELADFLDALDASSDSSDTTPGERGRVAAATQLCETGDRRPARVLVESAIAPDVVNVSTST